MLALDWLYYLLLLALLIIGLFLNILGLPGLWLMVAAFGVYAWVTWPAQYVGWAALAAVLILALLAELVEFLAGAAGSKVAGGSKRGMAGAIVGGIAGGIVGTPVLPVIGTIIGACVGSFIGAFGVEVMIGRTHADSWRIGMGAAKGRFIGIIGKLTFGIIMLFVALITGFPTGRPLIAPAGPAAPVPPTTQLTQPADPVPPATQHTKPIEPIPPATLPTLEGPG